MRKIFLVLTLLILAGCSNLFVSERDFDGGSAVPKGIINKIQPFWLEADPKFVARKDGGDAPINLFFDVHNNFSETSEYINYFVETVQGSKNKYLFDLATGVHYIDRPYCKQKDAWERTSTTINRPPFTIGIVPRMFDQLGMPQKIIIFGNKTFMGQHSLDTFFEGRVLGAYVEQVCPTGGCFKRDAWRSRLVLIGVQRDSEFDKYDDIAHFKSEIDWDEIKSFIENGQGKNFLAGQFYPGYRMGAVVDRSQAMAFLDKHAIRLSKKKLIGIKTSCEKLYDHFWKELSTLRGNNSKTKTISKAELKQKIKQKYLTGKSQKDELAFAGKFEHLSKKFAVKYNTCSRYYPVANVKENKERFWFFSYITAFYKLRDLGYSYNCKRGTWEENPSSKNGKRNVSLETEFKGCTNSKLDVAFMNSTRFLSMLNKQYKRTFRFVDYDKTRGGTHRSIYGWVETPNQLFSCDDIETRNYVQNQTIFPSDIRWRKLQSTSKVKSGLGDIIY